MLIRDRRAHEKGLLQSYLSALKHTGGPKRGIEDVWEEYDDKSFTDLRGRLLDR